MHHCQHTRTILLEDNGTEHTVWLLKDFSFPSVVYQTKHSSNNRQE